MFKRKRDWPMRVYQFRVYPRDIPKVAWERAEDARQTWNTLTKIWRTAFYETGQMVEKDDEGKIVWKDKEGQKARWKQCNEDIKQALADAPLGEEERTDMNTRFYATLKRINIAKGEKPQYQDEVRSMFLFHRFTGGGVPVKTLFSTRAKRFSLEYPTARYVDGRTPTRRWAKRGCRTQGHFGLGNDQQITFYAIIHRMIPDNVFVKRVLWNGKKTPFGTWVWNINVMVEEPHAIAQPRPEKAVAIDFGWRVMGEGEYIRVAYCVDSAGREFELRLNILEEKKKQARAKIPSNYAAWIAYDEAIGNRVEACKTRLKELLTPDQLRGVDKMRQNGLLWLQERLMTAGDDTGADEEIAAYLEELGPISRRRNALVRRLTNKRRHIYNNFTAWLLRTYEEVVWEDDLKIKKLKSRESKKHNPALQNAGKFAQWAAPGELRANIGKAAVRTATLLTGAPTMDSTTTCSQCGEKMQATSNILIECPGCGTAWDQDANACRNLLTYSQRCNGNETGKQRGQMPEIPAVLQKSVRKGSVV